jgi:glycosyl-4,4'-diaponeurosporenoate acyltransferase
MGDAYQSILAVETRGKSSTQIPSLYLGAIIIISCAACFTPIELFLVEIWPVHGFYSLLLLVASLPGAWLSDRLIPDRYYDTKFFESSGVYERLGIRFFKRLVPDGDYVNRIIRHSTPDYRLICSGYSLVRFEARTRLAERCHLAGLWLSLPSAVYALLLGWNKFALWLLLPNLPFHLYPILLQRYTRARIQKINKRIKRD